MTDEGKQLRDKSYAEYTERMKGKPTPTQAENDQAALGHGTLEHEHDGSAQEPAQPSEPHPAPTRQMEAARPARYATRAAAAAPPPRSSDD